MKIVVNTRLLRKGHMDGIGWFTYNTLQYIVKWNPDIEFHFLFDSGVEKEFLFADNVTGHNLFPPAKHAVLNVAWFEWSARRLLNKLQPDLFFSPDGILCLGWKGKQYGVMHDVNYVHRPKDLKWTNRVYYNTLFPKYAKKATRIGTVSQYSKNDIIDTFHIAPEKIDVVYSGNNSFYQPVDDKVKEAIRKKYTSGQPFFVFVSTLHPRKNIIGLMTAFNRFKKETGSSVKLVLAGKGMYKTNEMYEYREQLPFKDDIIFTGRVPDEEINPLVASALAMVYVPFFEGFGLPPIEAMQCDIPVIASNVTSVPEVVGDAGLLVDPHSEQQITDALTRMASDENLRQELIAKGRIRRDMFSWEKTAQLLWNSIRKTL